MNKLRALFLCLSSFILLPIILFFSLNSYAEPFWKGGCGAGVFENDPNDLWPSRTGCYNPEERFKTNTLIIHPYCIHRESLSGDEKFKNLADIRGNHPSNLVQCLFRGAGDYIDDIDNFCGAYTKGNKSSYEDIAKSEGVIGGGKSDDDSVFLNVTGLEQERYLRSVYNTSGICAMGAVYVDPRLTFKTSWSKYHSASLPTIKNNKQSCLKTYIESWAHRGDCGEIVLKGARENIDEGYCQWVEKYDDGSGSLRSEIYDFENFNSGGWLATHGEASDICKLKIRPGDGKEFNPGLLSDDPNSGLDFSKRGCPTTSGSNFWGGHFNKCTTSKTAAKTGQRSGCAVDSCDLEVGAKRINDPNNFAYTGKMLTTDINSPYSIYWRLTAGGEVSVPIINPDLWNRPEPIPEPMKNPPKMEKPGYEAPKYSGIKDWPALRNYPSKEWLGWFSSNYDWADYSWVARSCVHRGDKESHHHSAENHTHGFSIHEHTHAGKKHSHIHGDGPGDVHGETPDYAPPGPHPVSAPSKYIGGYDQLSGSANYRSPSKIHDNGAQEENLKQNPYWCEFQVPFDPYHKGAEQENFLRGSGSTVTKSNQRPEQASVHARINSAAPNQKLSLGFPMIERIRDGCGAFSMRSRWDPDHDGGRTLAQFMVGEDAKSRCEKWKGFYGKQYDDPKIVSWRLPRFDYEFLKAFLDCTGPIVTIHSEEERKNSCKVKTGSDGGNSAVCSNWHPSHMVCTGGGDDMECECVEDAPNPDMARPLPLPDKGFWCNCPQDNIMTGNCNENYCTCDQKVVYSGLVADPEAEIGNGVNPYSGAVNPTSFPFFKASKSRFGGEVDIEANPFKIVDSYTVAVCKDYGPFKRWLQCYYQARGKACPVLTRDISTTISPSTVLKKKPKAGNGVGGVCNAEYPEGEESEYHHIRWSAEEPNILARLPVSVESAGNGHKNSELVYESAVSDSEAPFLEPVIPYPVTKLSEEKQKDLGIKVIADEDKKTYDEGKYQKGLEAVSNAFRDTSVSTPENPSKRAEEAIVGPKGCDIGGWYEMMLYQARCVRLFKLNCLCDYNKTFSEGSAEAYVIKRSGIVFNSKTPYISAEEDEVAEEWKDIKVPFTDIIKQVLTKMKPAQDKKLETVEKKILLPLAWRGYLGPNYPENAKPGSKLWDKNDDGEMDDDYRGLSEARAGDFMIYDESIDTAETKYRRHVAFIESINVVDNPEKIAVSEWNWGKNLDSCGNTDRWKVKTTRNIYKNESDTPKLSGKTPMCDDPDMAECFEPNWKNIKLYRPNLDVGNIQRPVCDPSTFPKKILLSSNAEEHLYAESLLPIISRENGITLSALEKMPFDQQTAELEKARLKVKTYYTLQQRIDNDTWKLDAIGYYDGREVRKFIETWDGRCDPPLNLDRTNIETEKSGSLTPDPATACISEDYCQEKDNSKPHISPGNAGITEPVILPAN